MSPLEIFFNQFIGIILIAPLFLAPSSVVFWRLIDKLELTGWQYLIPVYNMYILGRAANKPTLGIWSALIYGLIILVPIVLAYIVSAPVTIIAGLILIAAMIAYLVLWILVLVAFAGRFNAGFGKWLVLLFFPVVGMFLVGKIALKSKAPATPPQSPPTSPATPITNTPQAA